MIGRHPPGGLPTGPVLSLLCLLGVACSDAPAPAPAQAAPPDEAPLEDGVPTGAVDAPTWHRDVAPVIVARCVSCHREGGIAPISFEAYADAAPWAAVIASEIEAGRMPPFSADDGDDCEMTVPFEDDLRLGDGERALIAAWVDAGAPEGDPATAAPLPEPPELGLADPDASYVLGSVEIGGDQDQYYCFLVDPGIDEAARFLEAMQIHPGNPAIIHHVLVYATLDPDAEAIIGDGTPGCFHQPPVDYEGLIGGWAPGAMPYELPDGVGFFLQRGTRLVAAVHYHPTGGPPEIDDATTIDLRFADEMPEEVAMVRAFGNALGPPQLLPDPDNGGEVDFLIPAGAPAHVERMSIPVSEETVGIPIPDDGVKVWMAVNHMHMVGVDMLTQVRGPGDPTCLLHIPRYDFGWQRAYLYDAPLAALPRLHAGDRLDLRCTYDNSLDNPGVRQLVAELGLEGPGDVGYGDSSYDEMCLTFLGLSVPTSFLLELAAP